MLWKTVAMSPTLAFPRVNRSTTQRSPKVHPRLSVVGSHPSRAFSDRNCFWWSSHPSCGRKKKNPEPSQQLATCHCPHQVRETYIYIIMSIWMYVHTHMGLFQGISCFLVNTSQVVFSVLIKMADIPLDSCSLMKFDPHLCSERQREADAALVLQPCPALAKLLDFSWKKACKLKNIRDL